MHGSWATKDLAGMDGSAWWPVGENKNYKHLSPVDNEVGTELVIDCMLEFHSK